MHRIRIRIKEFKHFNPAITKHLEIWSGIFRILGQRSTESRIRIRNTAFITCQLYCGWDLASDSQCRSRYCPWFAIPASSGTVKSEGRQMKQCWISYIKKKNSKKSPFITYNPDNCYTKHLEIWSGIFIADHGSGLFSLPDPGSRGQKSTESRIQIRNTAFLTCLHYCG